MMASETFHPTHPSERDRLDTLAVHGGVEHEPRTGAVVTPVFQTTTFAQPQVGADLEHTYSRASNPTVRALERRLAAFEGLPHALAFSTGMAALTTLALATLRQGSHVLCSDVVYGGTVRLFERVLAPLGVETDFVDSADLEAVAAALRPETRLVLVETPANPTLKLTDIGGVAALLAAHPALLAVDNTFLTAALQRPAALGADLVVYSTTKYIEGHNTTVGGALVLGDDALAEQLDLVRKTLGTIQSPWDAWLTDKGLKTLPLRMRRHSESALEVARWLAGHPAVERVHYPFLEGFAQLDLARRQQAAGGGMLAFDVRGGRPTGIAVMNALELCVLAENLGATETLVTHPPSMTHADLEPELRRRLGISDGLIRLSVGLENPADLIADLEAALAIATDAEPQPRDALTAGRSEAAP